MTTREETEEEKTTTTGTNKIIRYVLMFLVVTLSPTSFIKLCAYCRPTNDE